MIPSPKVENAIRGVRGRHRPTPGDTDYLDAPTYATLTRILARAGVRGDDALIYLARRVRWLLGKDQVPVPPATMARDVGFVNRRAVELVDEHRATLPAPVEERMRA